MEAFDETLDRRIWSLADNRIKWHTLIAEKRRKVPSETEKTVVALLKPHHKLDVQVLPTLSADADAEGTIHEQDGKLLDLQSLRCLLTRESGIQMERVEQILLETSSATTELNQVSNKGSLTFPGLSPVK